MRRTAPHALSSKHFSILPQEDGAEFSGLLQALEEEYVPETTEPSSSSNSPERQWKIARVNAREAELLAGEAAAADRAEVAVRFR